jgi:hypothetical protein
LIVVFSAAVAGVTTTVAVVVIVTTVTVTAVSVTIAVAIADITAVVIAATNVSCRPLTAPPSCCLAQAGCCVASHCNALSFSCCAALSSYRHPLTALPSCCLISPAGCCVASHCTALSSSSHSAALIILRQLVVALPLVAPPSCCAALLSCPRPLTASSHCTALSLSHLTGWLLRCLSSRCPLVVLLLLCSFVVLRRLVVALPLVAPPSSPLIVLYLKLVKPGFLDPFDTIFIWNRPPDCRKG